MEILSHRGCWQKEKEKNTAPAFERAFSLGFGIETDIRDYNGELVISHDIADVKALKLEHLFDIYKRVGKNVPLALNIKADGLQLKLRESLGKYAIENYFVFDMSVPEALVYRRYEFKIFARQSEYESVPVLYDAAAGVWLDEFHSHWVTEAVVATHKTNNKKVCIVSPDLHKRDYQTEWNDYRNIQRRLADVSIMLCTDFPEKAKEFFDVEN